MPNGKSGNGRLAEIGIERMDIVTIRGHTFIANALDATAVVVDLGAHKGEFSSEINRRYGCRCHMVEALPALYAQIEETASLKKYPFAMASSDGPLSLFVSDNPEANSIAQAAGMQATVPVEGVTLATFMVRAGLDRIDLLKIDIEGAEIGLLESAGDDVFSAIGQITIEFHDFVPGLVEAAQVEAVTRRLEKLGFSAIKFSRALNTDVLFVNQRFCHIGPVRRLYYSYIIKYLRGIYKVISRYVPVGGR